MGCGSVNKTRRSLDCLFFNMQLFCPCTWKLPPSRQRHCQDSSEFVCTFDEAREDRFRVVVKVLGRGVSCEKVPRGYLGVRVGDLGAMKA